MIATKGAESLMASCISRERQTLRTSSVLAVSSAVFYHLPCLLMSFTSTQVVNFHFHPVLRCENLYSE